MTQPKIEFEESCGNVFADPGLEDAEKQRARGMIGFHAVQLLQSQGLKQH